MHRPQPTAPGRAELDRPQLVGEPFSVARLRGCADAAAMDIREVHGETGVPRPPPLGTIAGRSVVSSTVLQKQVGHTIVQLAHARHRDATSSQRGCSRLRSEQFGTPSVSSTGPSLAPHAPCTARMIRDRTGPPPHSWQRIKHVPATHRSCLDVNACRPSSRISVSARSKPDPRADPCSSRRRSRSRLADHAVDGEEKRPLTVRPTLPVGVHEHLVLESRSRELARGRRGT